MSAGDARRAFTLIEVLIAVLILGLALLGLAAVFPVAVRAQRQSADDTLGIAAMNSARAFLNSFDFKSAMEPWNPANTNPPYDTRNFWRDWRDEEDDIYGLNHPSPSPTNPSADDQGFWVVPPILTSSFGKARYGVAANTSNPQNPRPQPSWVDVPLRERLFPRPVRSSVPGGPLDDPQPQFVWDIAVHRVPDFNGATDSTYDDLEVAIFVRRIDQGIMVPPGHTLYEVLTGERVGGVAMNDRRVPCGIAASGPRAELPTGDGTGKYGVPIKIDVSFDFNPPADAARDRLRILDNGHKWEIARQPGQKLVDNMGQIHTVRRYERVGSNNYVILDAPITLPASSTGLLQEVVCTPQVPASVFVVKVKP